MNNLYTVEEFRQKIAEGSDLLPYSDEELKEINETLDHFESINETHAQEIQTAKDETAKKWRVKMQERFQDIQMPDNAVNEDEEPEEEITITLDDIFKWKEL